MNYVLTVVLLLVILYFGFLIYQALRSRARSSTLIEDPENLHYILARMTHVIQTDGKWDRLEFMRDEVRRSLRMLDDMRHDRSNKALRASKQRLEDHSRCGD